MFKKVLTFILAVVMCISSCAILASCGGEPDADLKGMSASPLAAPTLTKDFNVPADFKIGFIFLHDENSTYDKNFIDAANSVKELLGLTDDQVIVKTNIPESTECKDAAIELADKGCKIVFADSFGHEQFMIQAAKERPNVEFCHATGTQAHVQNIANYHNAFASIYQGRYLAGIAAGMKLNEMIADGKITAEQAVIGYVGAFTYAEVISGMTSFYLGAKSVCPSATMKVRYTGSWYDQPKEAEAAEALIANDKCVLISQHADSMGAPATCESKGVPNISYNGSTYAACSETFIVSSAINWAPYFLYIIKSYCTEQPIATDWCGGIAEGSVVLSGINLDVAAEGTVEAIETAIAQLKAGTLKVFDVTKDNYITVNGQKLTEFEADLDGDFEPDTNVIHDGYIDESGSEYRSAPFINIVIDGIVNLNTMF